MGANRPTHVFVETTAIIWVVKPQENVAHGYAPAARYSNLGGGPSLTAAKQLSSPISATTVPEPHL